MFFLFILDEKTYLVVSSLPQIHGVNRNGGDLLKPGQNIIHVQKVCLD